jgi:hypothetical protein
MILRPYISAKVPAKNLCSYQRAIDCGVAPGGEQAATLIRVLKKRSSTFPELTIDHKLVPSASPSHHSLEQPEPNLHRYTPREPQVHRTDWP